MGVLFKFNYSSAFKLHKVTQHSFLLLMHGFCTFSHTTAANEVVTGHFRSLPLILLDFPGERVQNGDHSDAHMSTFSHSSKEVSDYGMFIKAETNLVILLLQDVSTEGSPKKDKKKKKGLRTPSFLKKKKDKKRVEA